MKKISIIVPIHNSASYMDKCIMSCIEQTMTAEETEIILVDDCSSDESPALIKEYSEKYNNIIPIYLSENLRQGGARNRGIKAASGEYIAFVDSDDWIEPDMCEVLYNAAKNSGAEMSGGSFFISTDTTDEPKTLGYKTSELKAGSDGLFNYIINSGFFWNRIYKRDFLIKNNIFFPEGVFYEDAYFNFMSALYAKNVIKTDKSFYHYNQRENSTMRNRNNITQYERITVAQKIYDDSKERNLFPEYKKEIEYKYLSMMSGNVLYTCLDRFDTPDKDKIKEIGVKVKTSCPGYKKSCYYKKLIVDLRCYLWLSIHCPALAVWLYKHNFEKILTYYKAFINKFRKH